MRWLVVVGGQRSRVGFKLRTLVCNSLQKLILIGTAASWTWRLFKWPALPLTAGGVLDKQHQEVASKRQKKHTWKNCVWIWSKCFPDSSAPKRHADHFSSKAISSWGNIPKTKKYTAEIVGQKDLRYSKSKITWVKHITHCFTFNTQIWRPSVRLQPEKAAKNGRKEGRNAPQ